MFTNLSAENIPKLVSGEQCPNMFKMCFKIKNLARYYATCGNVWFLDTVLIGEVLIRLSKHVEPPYHGSTA